MQKDELLDLYRQNVLHLVEGNPSRFIEAYLGILECPLGSRDRRIQNLVDQQAINKYNEHLNKLDRLIAGALLQEIVRTADGVYADWLAAMHRFGKEVRGFHADYPHWGMRQFVGTLLMLHCPDRHVGLGIGRWNTCARKLFGIRGIFIKSGSVIEEKDAAECLELASQVRRYLDDVGWQPRDMIDVHAFLKVVG